MENEILQVKEKEGVGKYSIEVTERNVDNGMLCAISLAALAAANRREKTLKDIEASKRREKVLKTELGLTKRHRNENPEETEKYKRREEVLETELGLAKIYQDKLEFDEDTNTIAVYSKMMPNREGKFLIHFQNKEMARAGNKNIGLVYNTVLENGIENLNLAYDSILEDIGKMTQDCSYKAPENQKQKDEFADIRRYSAELHNKTIYS
jgi:hypothetical protein